MNEKPDTLSKLISRYISVFTLPFRINQFSLITAKLHGFPFYILETTSVF